MKPELPYPEGYCAHCKEHIRENDLFGRFRGSYVLYCDSCFVYYKTDAVLQIYQRYQEEDLIGGVKN
jgi:hypothetical protein